MEEKQTQQQIEEKWRNFWEEKEIYKFNQKNIKKIYSIDTPPPTVSGEMHMGHACSYSQQDFIARYKRMQGFNVFYPFGTDDNGLPTERLVEKKKEVKAKKMLREDFIKLCIQFLKETRTSFIQDWKNMGVSCDWTINYSTIDNHSRKIAQWSFIDLYKKGRIYRKQAPAMWCPECKTGVAQIEVKDKEFDSTFNDILFKCGRENLTIATTRPELLPACVALMINPNDKRYKKYSGKMAKVPLFDFEVPIIEDIRVREDKGTGIVMCCTFGDQTDMEWQKAYNLQIKKAINEEGRMTEISGKYKSLTIKEARKEILKDLKEKEILVSQKPIKHAVNVHERCDTEIEFITSKQWFVRYLDLKKDMLKWGQEFNWYPENMRHRYNSWIEGLQWDWLISNQRYFGVAFPVWYCKKCDTPIIAEEENLPVDPLLTKPIIKNCPKCKSSEFIPDNDVLNTWFTSSLTPQLAIQLMPKAIQPKLFPMDLRPQAHEIITFWLFNTVVKSHLHYNKTPWKNTMISGLVTLRGEKMSKSKGNVVKPQEVLQKYGADALRYWSANSKVGDDIEYQEQEVLAGTKFLNKIQNATNFVFTNLEHQSKTPELNETDRLFLNEINATIKKATEHFEKYDYAQAKMEADRFFWKVFADNYIEIVKNRLYNGTKEEKASADYTLYQSLLTITKMMAPFIPFMAEEIYQKHFKKYEKSESIHISEWPTEIKIKSSKDDEKIWQRMLEIIYQVRQAKSEAKKSMKAEVILIITKDDFKILKNVLSDIKSVCNAKEIKEGQFEIQIL
ncbi:valine--tRNA ligase [Candidatus Pacearchaeota archaeon]|nr:valine--tRNA ligase [Candidatus Pacearchaeota archaeon]